jgi:hypothetical protein
VYGDIAGSIAPSASRRRVLSRAPARRVWCSLLAIVFLGGNALVAHDLVTTSAGASRLQAEAHNIQLQLQARHADLAALQTQVQRALEDLERHTAGRNAINARTASARAATASTRAKAAAALKRVDAEHVKIGSLTGCLAVMHRAMNALSVGDTAAGSAQLFQLGPACTATTQ